MARLANGKDIIFFHIAVICMIATHCPVKPWYDALISRFNYDFAGFIAHGGGEAFIGGIFVGGGATSAG